MKTPMFALSLARRLAVCALVAAATVAAVPRSAEAQGPAQPTAVGDPNAKVGGSLTMRLDSYPRSLNYHVAGDVYGGLLSHLMLPSLGFTDYETRASLPYAAKSWQLAEDKLSMTVQLDERAKWADGTPLTADDVVYTWQAIFEPKNDTGSNRGYLDGISIPEKVDQRTLRFKFDRVHWNNIDRVLGLYLYQKSKYDVPGKNFNKDFNEVVFSGGPYTLDTGATRKNRKIVLKRNADWWGWGLSWTKGLYNFGTITMNVVQDDRVAFEALKKGDLSFVEFRSGLLETWVKETGTPQFQGNPIVKLELPRANPVDVGLIVLNMRRGAPSELKFREALQHLFNRDLYIEKIFYGLQGALSGPFGLNSPYASPNVKPTPFDPARAQALLKELGYTQADSDGTLFKTVDGQKQRAELTIMYAYNPHEKYLTVFKEDARKAGILINLKYTEWAPMMKLVEDFKFDAIVMGWSGSPEPAPEQIYLSKFANTPSSSNYAGYANPEVDKLIEQGGATVELDKRYPVYHQIHEQIAAEHPYLWRWAQKSHHFGYNKDRVAVPAKTPRFSGDTFRDPAFIYWWDPRVK